MRIVTPTAQQFPPLPSPSKALFPGQELLLDAPPPVPPLPEHFLHHHAAASGLAPVPAPAADAHAAPPASFTRMAWEDALHLSPPPASGTGSDVMDLASSMSLDHHQQQQPQQLQHQSSFDSIASGFAMDSTLVIDPPVPVLQPPPAPGTLRRERRTLGDRTVIRESLGLTLSSSFQLPEDFAAAAASSTATTDAIAPPPVPPKDVMLTFESAAEAFMLSNGLATSTLPNAFPADTATYSAPALQQPVAPVYQPMPAMTMAMSSPAMGHTLENAPSFASLHSMASISSLSSVSSASSLRSVSSNFQSMTDSQQGGKALLAPVPRASTSEVERALDDALLRVDFNDITVSELKDLLRQRGRQATGRKALLAERLKEEIASVHAKRAAENAAAMGFPMASAAPLMPQGMVGAQFASSAASLLTPAPSAPTSPMILPGASAMAPLGSPRFQPYAGRPRTNSVQYGMAGTAPSPLVGPQARHRTNSMSVVAPERARSGSLSFLPPQLAGMSLGYDDPAAAPVMMQQQLQQQQLTPPQHPTQLHGVQPFAPPNGANFGMVAPNSATAFPVATTTTPGMDSQQLYNAIPSGPTAQMLPLIVSSQPQQPLQQLAPMHMTAPAATANAHPKMFANLPHHFPVHHASTSSL
ncbi:hypothetical protein H9P43_000851 [Blastocladiella emersonii ATCC 22665]|nr:hypothetical protein H9P43_000851 [Blastocladiella emersonii ATCC 22665]